jgi:NADP-dependent 3-hydroxy acid dehydrogenase YdfG
MSSVRAFVDIIKKEEKKVDILINNAGVVSTYWKDCSLLTNADHGLLHSLDRIKRRVSGVAGQ